MKQTTSPPTLSSRATLSVTSPFDVEIIAIPKPFKTLGTCFESHVTLKPGLEILFNPEITFSPFGPYFKAISHVF